MSDATMPSEAEVIRAALDARVADLHVALPGRVESYDATKQTATVKPLVRRAVPADDGSIVHESLPALHNVPIAFPQGGRCSITWPLTIGDAVLLVFCSSAIQQWRASGVESDPGDLRRHALGNAVAYAGIGPVASSLPQAANTLMLESVAPGGLVQVGAAAVEFVALATKVFTQLDDLKMAISGWTPVANDGGAALKTALTAWLASSSDVASAKLKSE